MDIPPVDPLEDALRELEPDQFRRYSALRCFLAAVFGVESPSTGDARPRILDIGSGPERLTSMFLGERYEVVRADIETFGQNDIVLLDPDQPLPFEDAAFDAVVAIEVLEHVARDGRETFVQEAVRVSRSPRGPHMSEWQFRGRSCRATNIRGVRALQRHTAPIYR